MLKYRLQANNDTESKYYNNVFARVVITDEINLDGIAERIQQNCSMKKSDVVAVMTEFVEVLKSELQASHKVVVDGLGSFKMGIKGTYAKNEDAFSASLNISGYRVNFRPEYTVVKTGTYVDEKTGKVKVKKVQIDKLTEGTTAEMY